MAAISGIEAIGASQASHPGAQRKGGEAAAADFGAAVTHRDLVREKLRVDPAALADKKRAAHRDAPPPRDDYNDERPAPRGAIVDIEV
jgi:hypothetical protein